MTKNEKLRKAVWRESSSLSSYRFLTGISAHTNSQSRMNLGSWQPNFGRSGWGQGAVVGPHRWLSRGAMKPLWREVRCERSVCQAAPRIHWPDGESPTSLEMGRALRRPRLPSRRLEGSRLPSGAVHGWWLQRSHLLDRRSAPNCRTSCSGALELDNGTFQAAG